MSKRSEIRKLNKKLEKGELNELLVEKDISKLSKADREQWKKDKEKLLSWGYVVKEKSGRRTTTHFSPDKKTTEFEMPRFAKQMLSSAAKAPVKLTFRGIRSAGQKVNPLNKQINKNDVADTGVESLRLAHSTVKKTKSAVKTTKSAATTTVRAAKTTVKATQYTFKFVYEVAAQAVAIVINPLFLFIAGIVLILMMLLGAFMLLIGGQNNSEEAMTTAEGLVEVVDQYNKAKDFYNQAVSDRKKGFTNIVDNMYYNSNDPEHSHLVYFESIKPHPAVMSKRFASDENKDIIKSYWDYQIDEKDMIATVYV